MLVYPMSGAANIGKRLSNQSLIVLPACVNMHCHFHTSRASTYIGVKIPVFPGWPCVKATHGRMEDRAFYLSTGFTLLFYPHEIMWPCMSGCNYTYHQRDLNIYFSFCFNRKWPPYPITSLVLSILTPLCAAGGHLHMKWKNKPNKNR